MQIWNSHYFLLVSPTGNRSDRLTYIITCHLIVTWYFWSVKYLFVFECWYTSIAKKIIRVLTRILPCRYAFLWAQRIHVVSGAADLIFCEYLFAFMPCGPDVIHAFKMSRSLRFKSDSLHWHNDGKLNYYQWIRHSMCRVYKYEHVLCDPV